MASPQRSKTESMNAPSVLALPVARASVPSNMSKTPPTNTMIPPASQSCPARSAAPTTVIAKPTRVSPSGVRPRRPIPSAIGSKTFLIVDRDSFEIVMCSAGDPEDCPFAGVELVEGCGPQAADRLAPDPARLDDTGRSETAQMPGHERLGEPHMVGQLGHRRITMGEPAHDAQPVHVGHDLVEGTQLAEIVRLGDGRGD